MPPRGCSARRCGELDTLSLRKAVAGGDGFADGFPTAALAALLKAKLAQPAALQGRLGEDRRRRPNMKQNAYFCVLGLDQSKNMHYCAC